MGFNSGFKGLKRRFTGKTTLIESRDIGQKFCSVARRKVITPPAEIDLYFN